MKNRICPKCDGNEIYTNAGVTKLNQNRMSIDVWAAPVMLDVHMCMNCGYLEYYVARPMDREKAARKWAKVN